MLRSSTGRLMARVNVAGALRSATQRTAHLPLAPASRSSVVPAAQAFNVADSRRSFSSSSKIGAPSNDPGGKPNDGSHRTVYDDFNNILSGGEAPPIVVASMSDSSITLTDGLVISSPCFFLEGNVLLWDAPALDSMRATPGGHGWEEWIGDEGRVRELFGALEVVNPRPEVLLFGTGKTVLPPPPAIKRYINSLGIQVDVQSTRNACSTFNLLSEEGRRVAAALLPNQRSERIQRVPFDEVDL